MNVDIDADPLTTDELWVYNVLTGTWSHSKCVNRHGMAIMGTSGATACLLDASMYIFKGNIFYRVNLDQVGRTITFHRPRNMGMEPIPVERSVSWSYNGRVYIFGGRGMEPSKAARQHMQPGFSHHRHGWNNQLACYDTTTNEWSYPQYRGNPPCPRYHHAMAQIGNQVFVFGGLSGRERLDDLWCLNMDTMRWVKKTHLSAPAGSSHHSLTANADGKLVLFGGISNNCELLKTCWVYGVTENRWYPAQTMMGPRRWHTAVFSPRLSEIFIVGGRTRDMSELAHDIVMLLVTHKDRTPPRKSRTLWRPMYTLFGILPSRFGARSPNWCG